MRYSPEDKARTRRRILHAAARLFRRRGYHGVGIEAIMGAAGLTRGGFYGHFRSKAHLFAEVLAGPHDFNRRMASRPGKTAAELRQSALAIAGSYLDPANRERIGPNCSMASLSIDVARGSAAARVAYAAKLKDLVGEFTRGLDRRDVPDSRALRAVTLSVGGLIIARALGDDDCAVALLNACRDGVERELMQGLGVRD